MALDRSFIERNRASTERIRAAGRLSAEEMRVPVGPHWTVSIVLAHLAFWDRRVLYVLERTEQEGKLFAPQIDVYVNDLSLPLWAAVPPEPAARIALETAAELDLRLEQYSPRLLEEIWDYNKRWVDRSLHRNEHLDEAFAALEQRR